MAHILVVDDEADIRTLVAAILSSEGHVISEAEDGESGLRSIEENHPDLIISDIVMPGMTGFDFLGEVRKNPGTAAVPLIFMTGVHEENIMRRGMELGADDFLEKPFTSEALLSAVRTRLRMRDILRDQSEKKLEHLRQSISLSLPHELRTPLNVILAFSQIMQEDARTLETDDIIKFSNSIHQAGERLHRLVENYLLYADVEITLADESMRKEVSNARTEHANTVLRSYADDKALEYDRVDDLTYKTDVVTLNISHDHLARIVTEVVDNALKFSQKGTTVTLTLAPHEAGGMLVVEDRGSGIRSDDVANVGAFVQFDRKMREQQGAGLGLAITRRIVDLYGGSFTIESTPERGTTVQIILRSADE